MHYATRGLQGWPKLWVQVLFMMMLTTNNDHDDHSDHDDHDDFDDPDVHQPDQSDHYDDDDDHNHDHDDHQHDRGDENYHDDHQRDQNDHYDNGDDHQPDQGDDNDHGDHVEGVPPRLSGEERVGRLRLHPHSNFSRFDTTIIDKSFISIKIVVFFP